MMMLVENHMDQNAFIIHKKNKIICLVKKYIKKEHIVLSILT